MTGKNQIVLCQAEVQAALQHYCRTVLFRKGACPIVKTVAESRNDELKGCFVLQVEEDPDADR